MTAQKLDIEVLVVFASTGGSTRRAAQAHADGAAAAGARAATIDAATATAADLLRANALILGSPIHMGTPHWEMKRGLSDAIGRASFGLLPSGVG